MNEQSYNEALERAKHELFVCGNDEGRKQMIYNIFPELKENEDKKIRKALIDFFNKGAENGEQTNGIYDKNIVAWLEKQGSELNSVDLSDCSEEYRKAYYDGWNNCNMQHSQCKSESEDEKIRKAIVELVHNTSSSELFEYDVDKEQCLDWLEKQGQRQLCVNDNTKEYFIKALERVEEANSNGYKLTDSDKNSWWEDFKQYIKL